MSAARKPAAPNLYALVTLSQTKEFRAHYTAAATKVVAEFAALWPMFAERGSLIMDVGLTGSRRGCGRARAVAAMSELLKAGILLGYEEPKIQRARLHGFNPDAMPRHPAFRYGVGDVLEKRGERREVVALYASGHVESRRLVTNADESVSARKSLRWSREKWRQWAMSADFVTPTPVVGGAA